MMFHRFMVTISSLASDLSRLNAQVLVDWCSTWVMERGQSVLFFGALGFVLIVLVAA
jgi:hypothetical protein